MKTILNFAGNVLGVCIALIVGIGMLILGIIALNAPKVDYLTTTGTIVEIQEEYDAADENYYHTVFIDYEIDGKTYSHAAYGAYDSSMKVGGSVEVLYDPANPEQIQAPGSEIIPYIIVVVAGIDILVTIFFLLKRILFH